MTSSALLLSALLTACERADCLGDCLADTDVVGCSLDRPIDEDETVPETGGLSCGDEIPRLADARVFRASELDHVPHGLDPDGWLLVLSSQGDLCSAPVGGFNCNEDSGYRLYLGLPPNIALSELAGDGYDFGPTAGEAYEAEIPSWIQIGLTTDCCSLTTPPATGMLNVEAFDADTREMQAAICSYGYSAELGHGLSGSFTTAPGC